MKVTCDTGPTVRKYEAYGWRIAKAALPFTETIGPGQHAIHATRAVLTRRSELMVHTWCHQRLESVRLHADIPDEPRLCKACRKVAYRWQTEQHLTPSDPPGTIHQ